MDKYFVVTYIVDNADDPWYSSCHKEDFIDKSAAFKFAEYIKEDLYIHDVEVFTGKIEGGRIVPDAPIFEELTYEGGEDE